MKLYKIFILIFLFFFNTTSYAIEIKSLVKVNNNSITNIDLLKEIKFFETINNKKINPQDKRALLERLIDEKIKYLETKKLKININKNELKNRVQLSLDKYEENIKNSKDFYDYIHDKLEISMKWNNLITSFYARKLEINTNEINEVIKSNKFSKIKKENLFKLEKQKKINILSKTHFNLVKKKYYIKYN